LNKRSKLLLIMATLAQNVAPPRMDTGKNRSTKR
jgi:hypothetical protein